MAAVGPLCGEMCDGSRALSQQWEAPQRPEHHLLLMCVMGEVRVRLLVEIGANIGVDQLPHPARRGHSAPPAAVAAGGLRGRQG